MATQGAFDSGSVFDFMPTKKIGARYGSVTPALIEAWSDLIAGCFKVRYWSPRWWRGEAGAYLLFKRPRLDLAEFEGHPGDAAALGRAVRSLAAIAGDQAEGSLLHYDLVDAVRHLASIETDALLQQVLTAYRNRDLAAGDRARNKAETLIKAIDTLIGTQQESLASWTADAASYAGNPADAREYVREARLQVTLWGGTGSLHDYASKAWQGLYADFYLLRWTQFFDALRASAVTGIAFDQAAVLTRLSVWEQDWAGRDTSPRRIKPTHPQQAVRDLLDHLDHA